MNRVKKTDDKQRKLTKAEQKRQERFEITRAELENKGYEMKEHTLGLVYANFMAFIVAIPFLISPVLIYLLINPGRFNFSLGLLSLWLFLFIYFAAIVLHELVHGITWAAFAENHFKSISFGIMLEMLTPYCNCSEPLKKWQYIVGSLMPLLVVGMIPAIIGALTAVTWLFLIGLFMIVGAGGDIIVSFRLLKYKSDKNEVVVYDHPTKCGFITFER